MLDDSKPRFPADLGLNPVEFYEDKYAPKDGTESMGAGYHSRWPTDDINSTKFTAFLKVAAEKNPSAANSIKELEEAAENHTGFNEFVIRCMSPWKACADVRGKDANIKCKRTYTQEYCQYNGIIALAYVGKFASYENISPELQHAMTQIQRDFKDRCATGRTGAPVQVFRYTPATGAFAELPGQAAGGRGAVAQTGT